VERYQRRLSGPLQDRFDLRVDLPAVPWPDLRSQAPAEDSATVRSRVTEARARQQARQGCPNGALDGARLAAECSPRDNQGEQVLARGAGRLRLSVRGVSRVLRVARTIADLEGGSRVEARHLAEALQFRLPDATQLAAEM